jgi:hypothetical protein
MRVCVSCHHTAKQFLEQGGLVTMLDALTRDAGAMSEGLRALRALAGHGFGVNAISHDHHVDLLQILYRYGTDPMAHVDPNVLKRSLHLMSVLCKDNVRLSALAGEAALDVAAATSTKPCMLRNMCVSMCVSMCVYLCVCVLCVLRCLSICASACLRILMYAGTYV